VAQRSATANVNTGRASDRATFFDSFTELPTKWVRVTGGRKEVAIDSLPRSIPPAGRGHWRKHEVQHQS